jgi:hypothetical protein
MRRLSFFTPYSTFPNSFTHAGNGRGFQYFNNRIRRRSQAEVQRRSAGRLILCATIAVVYPRMYFSYAFSDEAYYLAIPYSFTLGVRPFFDEPSIYQLAAFFTQPLIELYVAITGSSAGLVLFGRHLYFASSILCVMALRHFWKPLIGSGPASALTAVVVAYVPFCIFGLSYNTMTYFGLLAGLLLLLDVSPYRFQEDWTYPDDRVASWQESFARLKGEAPGRILDTHHYNPIADMLTVDAAGRDMAWSWLSWTNTRYVGDIIKTGFFDSMRIARARGDVREANTQIAAELSALANVRFVSRLAGISPTMPASDAF